MSYPPKSLSEYAQEINEVNTSKGWTISPDELSAKLLLIISEVIEATEDLRDIPLHELSESAIRDRLRKVRIREDGKPEGFTIELIDTIYRCLHILAYLNVNVELLLEQKLTYNKTRSMKHGRHM